jgi:ribulose-phosphate 3-epimerase
MSVRIAPSILAADFAVLGACIAAAERGGADLVHVDVMDGHFVPNLTVGPPVVRSIHRVTRVPLDVHLMIEDPDRYIPAFVEAGAGLVSVHVEVLPHLNRTISLIKSLGAQAGVVLNPSTPVGCLEDVAADVDFVLIMTVNPGFGGQTFIPRSASKVRGMRALLDEAGNPAPIEVDGGIDERNIALVVEAGADWIVAGSAVFGADDAEAATRRLKSLAVAAAQGRLAGHRGPR